MTVRLEKHNRVNVCFFHLKAFRMCDAGRTRQEAQSVQFTVQSDQRLCKNTWARGGSRQASHVLGGGGATRPVLLAALWWWGGRLRVSGTAQDLADSKCCNLEQECTLVKLVHIFQKYIRSWNIYFWHIPTYIVYDIYILFGDIIYVYAYNMILLSKLFWNLLVSSKHMFWITFHVIT